MQIVIRKLEIKQFTNYAKKERKQKKEKIMNTKFMWKIFIVGKKKRTISEERRNFHYKKNRIVRRLYFKTYKYKNYESGSNN